VWQRGANPAPPRQWPKPTTSRQRGLIRGRRSPREEWRASYEGHQVYAPMGATAAPEKLPGIYLPTKAPRGGIPPLVGSRSRWTGSGHLWGSHQIVGCTGCCSIRTLARTLLPLRSSPSPVVTAGWAALPATRLVLSSYGLHLEFLHVFRIRKLGVCILT
jgi:hypothetical protein